jgi:hypothetical protein
VEPFLQLLLVVLCVPGTHVLVADDESTHSEAFGNNIHQVLDGVDFLGLSVVLGDHAAGDDATEVVHRVDGGF